MSYEIIPVVLSESVIPYLTDEELALLAKCSAPEVNAMVNFYFENDNADPKCKKRVKEAYETEWRVKRYLEDAKTIESANTLNVISYSDIEPLLSIEQLQSYKDSINWIIEDERAVPYIQPTSNEVVKMLYQSVWERGKEEDISELKNFAKMIKKFGSLFREPQHTGAKGTIVKKIVRNKDQYLIILRGIDFLISKKQAGVMPASWRYL